MTDAIEGEIVNTVTTVKLTKHPEDIVVLLESAFNNGFNITEACQYAEISRETYYNWLGDDDVFSYRMSVAQSAPNKKAKQNIITAIAQGDPNISLRYLMLRDKDFKAKTIIEPPEGQTKTEDKLKEFMSDTDDDAYTDSTDAISSESTAEPESEG